LGRLRAEELGVGWKGTDKVEQSVEVSLVNWKMVRVGAEGAVTQIE